MKIYFKVFVVWAVLALAVWHFTPLPYGNLKEDLMFMDTMVSSPDGIVCDLFTYAELVTGCPSEVLRGLASTESDFTSNAIGDRGKSHGMFQLHSKWTEARTAKYGKFDPYDPAESAIIAGRIIQENLKVFDGDMRLAIAAYRQGVTGVARNGATDWYVDDVLFWRNNLKNVVAFFDFQGITRMEGRGYEHIDFWQLSANKHENTLAAKVSWRGNSSF